MRTFGFIGVVAQLGERVVRNDEVRGSIPLDSTTFRHHCRTGGTLPHRQIDDLPAGNPPGRCELYPHANGIHAAKRCNMRHDNHTRLTMADLNSMSLKGATIYDPQDEKVGAVSDVQGSGSGMQVMVDVGTFLGMGGKTVAIPITALDVMQDEDGDIHATTSWTKAQIKALPEHVGR
jgi:hypothetical protein